MKIAQSSREFVRMIIRSSEIVDSGDVEAVLLPEGQVPQDGTTSWRTLDFAAIEPVSDGALPHALDVGILVGPGEFAAAAGTWRLWARITSVPERPVLRSPEALRIIT